eukprot:9255977-Heterocapsa_arctica.AAC.1
MMPLSASRESASERFCALEVPSLPSYICSYLQPRCSSAQRVELEVAGATLLGGQNLTQVVAEAQG